MILKKNTSIYSIRWLDFYDSPETFGWLQFQDQSCFPSHSLECFYIRCLHQQQVRNENLKMKVLYISDIRSGQKLRKKTKILQTSSWPPLRFSSEVCHPPGRSSQELSWPGVQVLHICHSLPTSWQTSGWTTEKDVQYMKLGTSYIYTGYPWKSPGCHDCHIQLISEMPKGPKHSDLGRQQRWRQ